MCWTDPAAISRPVSWQYRVWNARTISHSSTATNMERIPLGTSNKHCRFKPLISHIFICRWFNPLKQWHPESRMVDPRQSQLGVAWSIPREKIGCLMVRIRSQHKSTIRDQLVHGFKLRNPACQMFILVSSPFFDIVWIKNRSYNKTTICLSRSFQSPALKPKAPEGNQGLAGPGFMISRPVTEFCQVLQPILLALRTGSVLLQVERWHLGS